MREWGEEVIKHEEAKATIAKLEKELSLTGTAEEARAEAARFEDANAKLREALERIAKKNPDGYVYHGAIYQKIALDALDALDALTPQQ